MSSSPFRSHMSSAHTPQDSSLPIDIQPPSYDADPCSVNSESSSPTYSAHPFEEEISLLNAPDSAPPQSSVTGTTSEWSFETRHMRIRFNPQIWGSSCPSYGLGSKIEGSIALSISSHCVEKISVALELEFASCTPTKYGTCCIALPLVDLSLYDHITDSSKWKDDLPFSIPFPAMIEFAGNSAASPPSFECSNYAASCQISYFLKVTLKKKGGTLRRLESKSIPIFYLPKSCPESPPMTKIPRPASIHTTGISPAYLHMFDRVLTTTVPPSWPSCSKQNPQVPLSSFQKSVNFSVPTPKCFTSGNSIPYAISICCPDQPVLPSLLLHHIRVTLVKRVSIITCHKKSAGDPHHEPTTAAKTYGEWPLTTGHLRLQNEYAEGLMLFRGSIRAGEAGKEYSFSVPELLEVQYILRVSITPPKYLSEHVPCFHYDEFVDITTDHWGAVDRELEATGGMPTPALGLIRCRTPEDDLNTDRKLSTSWAESWWHYLLPEVCVWPAF